MNDHMNRVMLKAWRDWHGEEDDDIPAINPSFKKGFNACAEILLPLLEKAYPHIKASAGAAHMLDGFHPRPHPLDETVKEIKQVISEG